MSDYLIAWPTRQTPLSAAEERDLDIPEFLKRRKEPGKAATTAAEKVNETLCLGKGPMR